MGGYARSAERDSKNTAIFALNADRDLTGEQTTRTAFKAICKGDGQMGTRTKETPQGGTQTARIGKLIDVDKMEISYSGLVYIDPTDSIGIARYFVDQVRNQKEVKAIPYDFIHKLITDPSNAGAKSSVLSWMKREWEKENGES